MARFTRMAAALGVVLMGLAAGCKSCPGGSCPARSSAAAPDWPPRSDPLYSTPSPSTLPTPGGAGGRAFEGSGSR